MLKKIFGGIRMTWPRLILFAVISGLITGLIALWVPEGNSFRQIAVTLEAWIVLAIIVVVNCEKPLEAACKTFVYFLISQPLVYLVQVPFSRMGWSLFGYYYPYWFYWTLATFPGAFIAWFIKRDDWIGALILFVALAGLILIGTDYLKQLLERFPRYLISTMFCFGMVPVLIIAILHQKKPRLTASVLSAAVLAVMLFLTFRGGVNSRAYSVAIGLDGERYPVTSEWTAELEDPENGTAVLKEGGDAFSPSLTVEIRDYTKDTTVILKDPDGKTYPVNLKITREANGINVTY